MKLGEKLQKLRKARGWSQEELAGKIEVSRQAISRWESGETLPDAENLLKLSDLFGVTSDYLLRDEAIITASVGAIPQKRPLVPVAAICAIFGGGMLVTLWIMKIIVEWPTYRESGLKVYTPFDLQLHHFLLAFLIVAFIVGCIYLLHKTGVFIRLKTFWKELNEV